MAVIVAATPYRVLSLLVYIYYVARVGPRGVSVQVQVSFDRLSSTVIMRSWSV